MFKKKMSVRAVRKYQQPAYPVVDQDGKIVFTPQDSKLSEIAKEIAKPAIAIALSTIMATSAQAAPVRRPEHEIVLADDGNTQDKDTKNKLDDDKKEAKIRKLNDKQIKSLVEELDFKLDYRPSKAGGEVRVAYVTEEQAKRILEKFFRKNGITFDYGDNFKRENIDFTLDAYNPDKKIGYEFDYRNNKELDSKELKSLEELTKKEKEHILLLDAERFKGIQTPQQVINKVQDAAEQFLKVLYDKGLIKIDGLNQKTFDKLVKELGSDNSKTKQKAFDTLLKTGIKVLDQLKEVKDQTELLKKLSSMIEEQFKNTTDDYYQKLDSDKPEVREATTQTLIKLDIDGIPYLKKLLEFAKNNKNIEVKTRVEMILQEVE